MLKKTFLLLTLLNITGAMYSDTGTISEFSGWVNILTPDKMADKYSTGLLNVYTDELGMVVKRRGTVKYNPTALTGLQSIRRLFTYQKTDTSSYLIACSSTSCFANNKTPLFSAIKTGLTASYTDDYCVVKNYLYRDNGYDGYGGRWDGSTYTDLATVTLSSISIRSVNVSTASLSSGGTAWTAGILPTWNVPCTLNVSFDSIGGVYFASNTAYCNVAITGVDSDGLTSTEVIIASFSSNNVTTKQFLSVASVWWYGLTFIPGSENTALTIRCNMGATGTTLVSGKYIEWWHNRFWKAGVSGNPNLLYYSEVNLPESFGITQNYIRISIDDGDIVKGLFKWGDRLLIMKQYKTGEITETSAGTFVLRWLNDKVGCLYDTSIAELNNYPIWLSHLGIMRLTGTNFERLSEPIDNFIKGLNQINSGANSWIQTSESDFDSGTANFNVSTTKNENNVIVNLIETSTQAAQRIYTSSEAFVAGSFQVYKSTFNGFVTSVILYMQLGVAGVGITTRVWFSDISSNTLAISDLVSVSVAGHMNPQWLTFHFSGGVYVSSGTEYLIRHEGLSYYADWLFTTNDVIDGSRWNGTQTQGDYCFQIVGSTTPEYISQQKNVQGTYETWQYWKDFDVTLSSSTTNDMDYMIKTATAQSRLAFSTWTAISDNDSITLTEGSWVQWLAHFKSSGVILNDVTVNWFGTGYPPCAVAYDNRYYLAVSTDVNTKQNNVVICYQKDNSWTMFNNLNCGAFAIMDNALYYGDSTNTGFIYKTDVANLYTDNDRIYDAYWTSKRFDYNAPANEKVFDTLWTTAESGSYTLNLDYRLDGYAPWTTIPIDLTGTGVKVTKVNLPLATKGRQIQFKVGNTNASNFEFKRLDVLYDLLPLR